MDHPMDGQKIDPIRQEAAKDLRRHQTEAERALWQCVRANRLAGWHFRRQQIIGSYIVDFYCHAARLIIEVDGDIHQQQIEYDQARTRELEDLGFRVLRFSNQAVIENIETVLNEIRGNLTPPPPSRSGKGAGGLGP